MKNKQLLIGLIPLFCLAFSAKAQETFMSQIEVSPFSEAREEAYYRVKAKPFDLGKNQYALAGEVAGRNLLQITIWDSCHQLKAGKVLKVPGADINGSQLALSEDNKYLYMEFEMGSTPEVDQIFLAKFNLNTMTLAWAKKIVFTQNYIFDWHKIFSVHDQKILIANASIKKGVPGPKFLKTLALDSQGNLLNQEAYAFKFGNTDLFEVRDIAPKSNKQFLITNEGNIFYETDSRVGLPVKSGIRA